MVESSIIGELRGAINEKHVEESERVSKNKRKNEFINKVRNCFTWHHKRQNQNRNHTWQRREESVEVDGR